ncbi:anaphase-promoting complex subunit 5 [Nicotiana tomentosiformis]|uniref:anaphase-promoting complex subunit 5 n=1 Tax=Nicotiana tomentosiformis TaxID=4098 RepID=UPI00051CAB60|nr:anaphase-promoting complex subunit 5 [Nicotiana tomentosiformis]XP_033509366.1 anaphase-promoting complex subunit 5 [Nicotiana tomentosiformis]
MAGISKAAPGAFTITPHKLSICILIQVYAPPSQTSVPFPFSSVSQHNLLASFLLSLTKSSEDIFEPKLDELISQLNEIGGVLKHWLSDHLAGKLSSLASPDDLFNFFNDLRGILGGSDSNAMDDDQIILDPSSNLGVFVRRCLLAFNLLSFEAVCHLLTNVATYCKESLSAYPPYELSHFNDSDSYTEAPKHYENMDLENFVVEKVNKEIEARNVVDEKLSFHNHAPKALVRSIEGRYSSPGPQIKRITKPREVSTCASSSCDASDCVDSQTGAFLRTNWQIQGYLLEQADTIERQGSSFTLNAFESVLKDLLKLAPELHRVHFLRYLNSLYHQDYHTALENIHRYFDYSAGTEGCDFIPSSSTGCSSFGRYEVALLCLGMMHFHFGHPKQALEVLTEAVRVSQQQNNDSCLAYTLAAICKLLSEFGVSNMRGLIGSSYSPVTSIGTSLSTQQLLYVLLRRSLKRAESLKLKRLVASNHLAMAKFDLTQVQRPLLSFGPKASMKLATCPINVCKELRLSSHLINDYGDEASLMISDGAFCTQWIKNLKKPKGSVIFSQENECRSNTYALQFCGQPCSIPGSVLQLLGSSYLFRATAWEIYGSAPLARMNALLYATCFADSLSLDDVALAYGKLIQHLAVFKGYKEAFAAMKLAEEKFLSVSKSQIQLVKLQLLHDHALHTGNLKLAQQLCDELGVLASSVTGVDIEIKVEASLRHARILIAANQFSQAAAIAHSLFCMCYKFSLQVENATVLLLLAEIHKRSGNAVLGIPYALASLSFCKSFNLDLLKASATLTLAELWLSLGSSHAKRALALIHGAFPVLLGHGGLELRARAFITEAKCYLADSSFSVSEEPEMVLEPLRQASEDLELLEYHKLAAEAFYLMAIVYDKLGKLDHKEEAAYSFRKHITALESSDIEDPLQYCC